MRGLTLTTWPGNSYPLGATFDGAGTNFALFSEAAECVQLCLFDEQRRETRIELIEVTAFVWHAYVPAVQPGQRYGFRVHGVYDPETGRRCAGEKLLLDPYAKAVHGEVDWDESLFTYRFDDPETRNDADSAPHAMLSVVINPYFDWAGDRAPRIPYGETVIYEAHVAGLTRTHPQIPENVRGTYAGVAHPVIIEHLQRIGATAIELMPVHQFVHDKHLVDQGLSNYWGYNTIGFLAPHNAYSSAGDLGEQVQEFKSMVRSLHTAGIEVILDVVYNHTAEGNHMGPTLSFRGIDNAAYYRLVEDDQQYYTDYTGTGNSLNVRHPHSLQLIMDSLRYWVLEMHVDGFRFDLASALAREFYDVDRLAAFFDLVHQDPIVSQVKLIAEPWDVGPGGYQVGNFPALWTEWNGRYRDTVRDFWRGEAGTLGEFAASLTGSADLYEDSGRLPVASINFITAHDGFTLNDLVSYNEKHNDANGENNADGESHNRSHNMGVEGPTDDPTILSKRHRQVRNLLATLLLSQGVPMITHGDELGRTQRGNNNVYAHDSELSWIDWDSADTALVEFVGSLARLRREHPVFRRTRFFDGHPVERGEGDAMPDIEWLRPDGTAMSRDDWNSGFGQSVGVFLNGQGIRERDVRGEPIVDRSFLLYVSAHDGRVEVTLPSADHGAQWELLVDTSGLGGVAVLDAGSVLTLEAISFVVLRQWMESAPTLDDAVAASLSAPTASVDAELGAEFDESDDAVEVSTVRGEQAGRR